jgi:uncharacterized protein
MRPAYFIVFLTVFLAVYGLVNFYIFIRGWQSIPPGSTLRNSYAIVFALLSLSFFAGRILERGYPSAASDLAVWAGSFWIAAMLYFFIIALLFDVLRLANRVAPVFPRVIIQNYDTAKYVASAAAICVVAVLLIAGHVNSLVPRVVRLDLKTAKHSPGERQVNIVAASDIHLGTIVGRHRLDRLIDRINSLEPDLVLLPGDVVDEDLIPVIRQNLGESLRNFRSRFGVFAVTGNHEYIGGVERACEYLSEHSVDVLRDRSVKVADSFYLVGREDRSCLQFTGRKRQPLEELLAGIDRRLPVLLMDHQPFDLGEAAQQNVDLQLSGHTHRGQLWPVNFIIRAIFEVGWGYRKKGGTHYYVSSGFGTWGPPVRIGHRPEIVQIRLSFE